MLLIALARSLSGRYVVHKEYRSQSLTVLSGTLSRCPPIGQAPTKDSPDAHAVNPSVDAVQQEQS
jgi:hypothetical protein